MILKNPLRKYSHQLQVFRYTIRVICIISKRYLDIYIWPR